MNKEPKFLIYPFSPERARKIGVEYNLQKISQKPDIRRIIHDVRIEAKKHFMNDHMKMVMRSLRMLPVTFPQAEEFLYDLIGYELTNTPGKLAHNDDLDLEFSGLNYSQEEEQKILEMINCWHDLGVWYEQQEAEKVDDVLKTHWKEISGQIRKTDNKVEYLWRRTRKFVEVISSDETLHFSSDVPWMFDLSEFVNVAHKVARVRIQLSSADDNEKIGFAWDKLLFVLFVIAVLAKIYIWVEGDSPQKPEKSAPRGLVESGGGGGGCQGELDGDA